MSTQEAMFNYNLFYLVDKLYKKRKKMANLRLSAVKGLNITPGYPGPVLELFF